MSKSDDSENSKKVESQNTTQSIFSKRLENGDRLIFRAVASLLIPVLIFVSIYLSTLTNEIEIENFYSTDAEFMEKQVIDNKELNLYAINIEEYRGYYGDGMGFDSEETINRWNPNLVKSADNLGISINLQSESNASGQFTFVSCTDGINNCDDKVRSGGDSWVKLQAPSGLNIYISYDSNWFTDSFLIVAVEDGFRPLELFITLDADRDSTRWFISMAITPFGVGICLYAAKWSNRDDITRGITFSNDQLDESPSSYALCLANTVMKPTVTAFYSSLILWIAIDGDWWGNPGAAVLAIILGLSPAVVRLCNQSSPVPNGRRMNLWGAILYFPLCYFAVFIALLTFESW